MTDINSITIGGRITSDITERDFGYLTTGTAKLVVHIACNKSIKKNNEWTDQTSFFDIEIWGKLAEAMSQKIYKGLDIIVTGSLKQDRWQDAQTGQNRSKVTITADQIKTFPKNAQGTAQGNPQNVPQNVSGQYVPQNNPQDYQMNYVPQGNVPQGASQNVAPQNQRLQIQSVEQNYQQGQLDFPPQESFPEDYPPEWNN